MDIFVPRTYTEVNDEQPSRGHILAEYRDADAYVLLGDPGSGKTESFRREALDTGSKFITARDFLDLEPHDDWYGTTLFIDALDETRAGEGDGRSPLGRIRNKLDRLGRPRFRLSCREADWLGASDQSALQQVTQSGRVVTLRLDVLTEDAIQALLSATADVPDPDTFLVTARQRGLADLLENPQTLRLLADAIRGAAWPESRAQTYDMACRQLVRELNPEHQAAKRGTRQSLEDLLDAAGYLCALMLIADVPLFSMDGTDSDSPSPEQLDPPKPLPTTGVLATRLFKGGGKDNQFEHVHRSVAEYLGARYIAQRISDGLPVSRVLALITGADGGVVAGLRGFHAWLAVHCQAARKLLIEADPLGVILYGDVKAFHTSDKQSLLEGLRALASEHAGFRWQDWNDSPFGALSTPDMAPLFQDILDSPERDDAHQALTACVLDALRNGMPQPSLASTLQNVVRDRNRWPGVRIGALLACLRMDHDDPSPLLGLLDDVHTGKVEDRDDRLLGILLDSLYPEHITPGCLPKYLHVPKDPNMIGRYQDFWMRAVAEKTPVDSLPVLLDELARQKPSIDLGREHLSERMFGELLIRGIDAHGEEAEPEQLYTWLGLGLDKYSHPRLTERHREWIAAWFSPRQQRFKDVLGFGIHRCGDNDRMQSCFHYCGRRLYGARPPNDAGVWFLSLAEDESNPGFVAQLLEEVVRCLTLKRGDQGLSRELLESWGSKHPQYANHLESLLNPTTPDWERKHIEEEKKWKQEKNERRQALRDTYREHFAELRNGTVHPQNLHNLAMAYFDLYSEVDGDTPRDRLMDLLSEDVELVEAALTGLRQTLFRSDLPPVTEIVKLEAQGQMHYVRLPCLAAAEEHFQGDPDVLLAWPDDVLKRLLAFRYTYGAGDDPDWAEMLAKARPDLVAEVLIEYAARMFSASKNHVHGIYALLHDKDYARVARLAVPALLKTFPLRARKHQLEDLGTLLKAGLLHMDGVALIDLIEQKLSKKSMVASPSQRIYWLSAGLIANPMKYEAEMAAYVGQNQLRARRLADFFGDRTDHRPLNNIVRARTLGLLIRLLGIEFPPIERIAGAHWVTRAMETSDLVTDLINRLGSNPDEDATHSIRELLADKRLSKWQNLLRYALHAQQVSRREALFQHPSIAEVEKTLSNMQPVNAADLAALTGELLREQACWIRNGNSDAYKQFWNLDSHARPTKPRVEDACRDTLLDRLRSRLSVLGIDIQPEGHLADDKRSDIRVSFGGVQGIAVPVEIKRDSHPDLWRAMRDQLINQYTRDPRCGGRGIYVVFWFGGVGMPVPLDGGPRPKNAAELEDRLRNTLTPEERRLIHVCVLDVSRPSE